jgi:hypothetical protein
MSLPYENTTAGTNAINEIQKILRAFDCQKFGTGEDFDTGELFVHFERDGRRVTLSASSRGYAAAWLKANPWNTRRNCSSAEYEAKALKLGATAVYSILRDWIKGQVTAVEIGMMTFEAAFLPHILLPSGETVMEKLTQQQLLAPPKAEP